MKTKEDAKRVLKNRLGTDGQGFIYQRKAGQWDWASRTSPVGFVCQAALDKDGVGIICTTFGDPVDEIFNIQRVA